MKTHRSAALAACFALLVAPLFSAELEPTLGKKGRVLLDEKFDGATLPKGWTKNTGTLAVVDGVLHAGEVASEKHVGAFRRALPLGDCAIQLDFKFAGATTFHLGFDPAPGELKKKGHLFSLVVTPEQWSIMEHADKADAASKNVVHAKAAAKAAPGEWATLLLEIKGDVVVAHLTGRAPLRASARDFHVKKPGLVFRVGGKDGAEMLVDNVKVWELQ
jgi:hypothetical protein